MGKSSALKKILFTHGKTYAAASFFFSKKIKEKVYILYAFVRILDDYVDTGNHTPDQTMAYFQQKKKELQEGESSDKFVKLFIQLIHEEKIPLQYPMAFIDSMIMDISITSYATFHDLEKYMFGSAYSIGVIMAYIMKVEKAYFSYAGMLGNAMQLTNFLRDIGEDKERGRLYIPLDMMKKYGYTITAYNNELYNASFVNLYKNMIRQNHEMYKKVGKIIKYIPDSRSRIAVRSALVLYEKILDKIVDENYQIYTKRVSTTRKEKILVMLAIALQKW